VYKCCFYVRETLGKNKKPIKIYKFRTQKKEYELITQNKLESIIGTSIEEESLTFLGKYLRKFWIDEIPQLYNLIKGDIKLIGFRPDELRNIKDKDDSYFSIKPGLIGISYGIPIEKITKSKCKNSTRAAYKKLYIKEYLNNPIKTDVKYFGRFLYNVVFKNVRPV